MADVDTTSPQLLFVHADHLDRPLKMTDAAQALLWDAVFLPFGEAQSVTTALNLRFPGQYFLIESGLHYNWHRHYDPTTGRYLQPDPLGFVDGPGVYAYATSAPTQEIDEDGQRIDKVFETLRKLAKDVHFEGPNEKFTRSGQGRICQVRYKDFRIGLDYQEYRRGEGPVLHLNIGPAGSTRHVPLNPRKWF